MMNRGGKTRQNLFHTTGFLVRGLKPDNLFYLSGLNVGVLKPRHIYETSCRGFVGIAKPRRIPLKVSCRSFHKPRHTNCVGVYTPRYEPRQLVSCNANYVGVYIPEFFVKQVLRGCRGCRVFKPRHCMGNPDNPDENPLLETY